MKSDTWITLASYQTVTTQKARTICAETNLGTSIHTIVLNFVFAFLICATLLTDFVRAQTPNCQTIAMPPPLATLDGPATDKPGETEVGIAVGAAGEVYPAPCGHEGGSNWLVRWRRGVSNHIDLGFDGLVETHSDGSNGGTIKFAARYEVNKNLRLEVGVGTSDSGFAGRSVNGDLAAVIGTSNPNKTWNYYASLRLGASHGCVNPFCVSGTGDHPPGALVPLGVIGTTARVNDSVRFVMEIGASGGIFSREHPDPGSYIHFSIGVLFHVGKKSPH